MCHPNTQYNMKIINKLTALASLAALAWAHDAHADLVGNYTADSNTVVLLHFDQPAGGSVVTNYGTLGSNFITANMTANNHSTSTAVTTYVGVPSYVSGPTNFGNALGVGPGTTTFGVCGFDYNNNGTYNLDGDVFPSKLLGIGNGGQTPFTLECLVYPTNSAGGTLLSTDTSLANRGFQFALTATTLSFNFITSGGTMSGTLPTTGNNAFTSNQWYHAAFTYDGTNGTLYWTLLNGTNGAAAVLATQPLTIGTAAGNVSGELVVAANSRNVSQAPFKGYVDEVRISKVARGSGQMQFYSPAVTITLNPVSQNVDYNLPVTFSVGASSQFPLGYQWRFNSNSIAGATNTAYTIPNTAAGNAGYYDCVVTNTIGYKNVSTGASLVVGAANFLGNRYSFNTNWVDLASGLTVTPDSVGGQTATNFGNAYVTNGSLVLDGTTGTFVQLPSNLFTAQNATALTLEFWATLGTNPNNVDVFAFGVTNYVIGSGIIGFNDVQYSPHTAAGQLAVVNNNNQSVTAAGNLDNQTVHVAVVVDAPDRVLSIYTNGVLEAINTNFTVNLSSLNDKFSWIGQSLTAASPNLTASIDEFRLFRGALSPISIAQSQVQGPNVPLAGGPAKFLAQPGDVTVPAGQPALFSVATIGYLPITYQWYKNGSPITGATNVSYAYLPPLGDNGATFTCRAANTIGTTTYLTNSTSATLNVFLPPTLAWLGSTAGGMDNGWNTSSLDWTNDALGGGIMAFTQTNGVLFDDRSGGGYVDLESPITPYSINVNATSAYTLTSAGNTGVLTGPSPLTLQNSGTFTIDLSNSLSGAVTISAGKLQIGNNDSSGSLGTSVVTNNSILSLNRGDTILNVGNAIHGTGSLSVDGSGGVTLSGNSDYTGPTWLNAGVTYLTSATGLGSPVSRTTVANGALLYVTANLTLANPLTLNGAALQKGGGGLTVDTAPVALASDATISLDGGATLVLSNSITGGFNLTAAGSASGTLTLATNNTISGFDLNGPVVNVGSAGALGTGTATVDGPGRLMLATGITLANPIVANTVSPGAGTGLIMVNDNTNGTVTTVSGPITFNVAAVNGGNFAGPVSSGYLNILNRVSSPGVNIVVRFGNVRFSGGGDCTEFQIRSQTTSLGANNGISTNAVVDIGANGSPTIPTYFDLNGFNQKVLGLKNTIVPTNLGMVTNSSAKVATLTLDPGTGNFNSFDGAVVGNIALVLSSGQQTFTGVLATNAYTGNTTVNGGLLELANASLATNSTVTIATGATLQLDFATTNQIGALVLNGASQAPGLYNSTTSPAFIGGAGSLLVVPPVNLAPTNLVATVSGGTLTLTWPADHTGWRLQAQTNSLTSGLGTNWVNVPNSSSSNSYSVTIDTNAPAVFYRLAY